MRGVVAKRLRKAAYGEFSLRERTHVRHLLTGQLLADDRRRFYQRLKRDWKLRSQQ